METLKEALLESLKDLQTAPLPEKAVEYTLYDARGLAQWRNLMEEQLSSAKTFEIHCWEDETDEIALALRYGSLQPSDWKHGSIIRGIVTPSFCRFLLDLPKPADTDIYDKLTPFFSIFLDNGFSSAHYGTELMKAHT